MADTFEPLADAPVETVAASIEAPVVAKPATAAVAPAANTAPVSKAVRTPRAAKPAKVVKAAKPVKTAAKPEAKAPAASKTAQPKELFMTKTADITAAVKTAFADIQGKAKTAYAKGSEVVGEAGTFTKGNVEALVESGKILSTGLKELGTGLVAEGKGAFETLTADVKELASAKTPTDFFKLQSDLLRKQFDASVAFGSKQSEALLKLASEAAAPVSGRVSLAVEKIKKVA